jgi:hypothetical protein
MFTRISHWSLSRAKSEALYYLINLESVFSWSLFPMMAHTVHEDQYFAHQCGVEFSEHRQQSLLCASISQTVFELHELYLHSLRDKNSVFHLVHVSTRPIDFLFTKWQWKFVDFKCSAYRWQILLCASILWIVFVLYEFYMHSLLEKSPGFYWHMNQLEI